MDRIMSKRPPLAALICFCVVYVALFCWLGVYACPQADDFYFSSDLARHGFWGFQSTMYMTATGRILNTFLLSLAALLPLEPYYWIFPIVTIITYIGALYLFMGTVLKEAPFKMRASLSLLLTAATLAFLSSLNETFYWLCGMPYFWTTSLLLVALSLAIRALRGSMGAFWLCLVVLFFNGTILELPCVLQGVVAFLAALCFRRRGDRRRAAVAGAFWLVSATAFLVIYFSPGTAIRMGDLAQMPFIPHLLYALSFTIRVSFFTIAEFFSKPIIYVFLLFLPCISETLPKTDAWHLKYWHIILLTVLIAPLMEAIIGWALGSMVLRVESLTLWMMGASWLLLWAFGYHDEDILHRIRSSRLFAMRWTLLFLSIALSFNTFRLIWDLRIAPRYKMECGIRTDIARQQGKKGVKDGVTLLLTEKPQLVLFIQSNIFTDSSVPYARYCGLATVTDLPDSLFEQAISVQERIRQGNLEDLIAVANKGDTATQFLLGRLYDPAMTIYPGSAYDREKIPEDRSKAIFWYRRAAEQGDFRAQRSLARFLLAEDKSLKGCLHVLYWLTRSLLSSLFRL